MRRLRFSSLTLVLAAPVWCNANAFANDRPDPAAAPRQEASQNIGQIPSSDSELPLLSILGMGLLTGGLLSALRTRPEK